MNLQIELFFYLHAIRNKKSDTELSRFLNQLESDEAWSRKPLGEDLLETGLVLYSGVATADTTRMMTLYTTIAQAILLHCLRQFKEELQLQTFDMQKNPTTDPEFWESTLLAREEAVATEARVFSQNPSWPTPQTP